MSRKRRKKQPRGSDFSTLKRVSTVLVLVSLVVGIVVSIAVVSYSIGVEEGYQQQVQTATTQAVDTKDTLHERLKQTLQEAKQEYYSKNTTSPLVKKSNVPLPSVQTPVVAKTQKALPKLAIILDDVSFAHEVREAKALGLKFNLSFFPVTHAHPHTAELAAREPFYMVHLPLEAKHFHSAEPNTLRVGDSLQTIMTRLESIKKDFPRLHYMNNHTGSTFTSDRASVKKLLQATERLGLEMVDSRTTAKTKMPAVYEKYHRRLLSRNIFLDHEPGRDYICGQLQKAVNYAKRHGSGIAIGHPRKTTLEALGHCKEKLKAVELVYISEL